MSSHKGTTFISKEKFTFWEHAVFQVFAKSTQVLSMSIFSSPGKIHMLLMFSLVNFQNSTDLILRTVIRLKRIVHKEQVVYFLTSQ